MSQMFKVDELSLHAFFSNTESFYQIPDYQRPYSWTDHQVNQLWEDLHESFKDGNKSYFLGTIVTNRGEGDKRYNIIDGQQRVTTLTILFATLKAFITDEEIIDDLRDAIFKKTENRIRFFTHSDQQSIFENLINKTDFISFQTKNKKDVEYNEFQNSAFEFVSIIAKAKKTD